MILIQEGKNYSITSECHEPRIPESFRNLNFNKIINEVLGKKAFISIAFVRQLKIQKINKQYRGIDKSTDTLSFRMENGGEILLSLPDSRKKARLVGVSFDQYLPYLLVHSLLHLKGYSHGSKMDRQEKNLCKLFNLTYPHTHTENRNELQNNSRNRHRNLPSQSSRLRKPR